MNPENYKSKRKTQPKRNRVATRSKSQELAKAKVLNTSPKLREIYATKTEWAIKTMPKLKE